MAQEERILTPCLYESFGLDSLHSLNRSIEAICEKNAGCNFQPESKTHGNVAINADDALPDPEIKDKQAADDSTMDITAQVNIKSAFYLFI